MDEIVDFLALNIVFVVSIGAFILLSKFVVVYLLIRTKKPKMAFSRKSFFTIFKKSYDNDDIKKSKKPFRVFLKKTSNLFKPITYIWLILVFITIFFKFTAYRNNSDAPIENTQSSTPANTEE